MKTIKGFPGYKINEKGQLISKQGKVMTADAKGNVRLIDKKGKRVSMLLISICPTEIKEKAVKKKKEKAPSSTAKKVEQKTPRTTKLSQMIEMLSAGKGVKEIAEELDTNIAYVYKTKKKM